MSPCPSAARAIADISSLLSRLTARPIDFPLEASGPKLWASLANRALARTMEPRLVDGGDRHRRMVEEAHEAHFGGALRVGTLVARAVDHDRARGAGGAVGAERELVIDADGQRLAAARAQIEVEHLGLDFARRRHDAGQQRRAVARDDVGQLQTARTDLGQVVVEPVRQRRVDVRQRRTGWPKRSRSARDRDTRSPAADPGTRLPAARDRA